MAETQATHTPERIFASVLDAAEMLSVSRGTVYNLMKDGLLDYRKIGARRVVPIAALHDYAKRLERVGLEGHTKRSQGHPEARPVQNQHPKNAAGRVLGQKNA